MTDPMLPRWLEERAKLRAERDQLLGLRDELCEANAKVGLLNVDLQMRLAAAEEERDAALTKVAALMSIARALSDLDPWLPFGPGAWRCQVCGIVVDDEKMHLDVDCEWRAACRFAALRDTAAGEEAGSTTCECGHEWVLHGADGADNCVRCGCGEYHRPRTP